MENKEKYFKFLDQLRFSGLINMFEAPKYLRDFYEEITKDESFKIFSEWAKDEKRHILKNQD